MYHNKIVNIFVFSFNKIKIKLLFIFYLDCLKYNNYKK